MKKNTNIKKLYELEDYILGVLFINLICIFLDFGNIPSLFLNKYAHIGAVTGLIFVVSIFINKKILGLMKLNVKNQFDFTLVTSLCGVVIYYFLSKALFPNGIRECILKPVIIILFLSTIIRLIYIKINEMKNKKSKEEINVCDLKDLYLGKVTQTTVEAIFLEEKAANYDLLNRNEIINTLYRNIKACKNKSSFVISLTGKWGSGKTTILNVVKDMLNPKIKDESFLIIDDFDVWKYNNEKTLFFAMFDEIMKKVQIKTNISDVRQFCNMCVEMLSNNADFKLDFLNFEGDTLKRVRNIIENYLEINNKRVVFIIDNIERTNSENIIVVMKTISTILNWDRFIYVLSYDEEEMKQIFNKKLYINYDYLEKVIQLQLRVPTANKEDIRRVCSKTLKELLVLYGIDESFPVDNKEVIESFIEDIHDLRNFKRKINSIFTTFISFASILNKSDFLLLELIKAGDYELYNVIKNNGQFFVSVDRKYMTEYQYLDARKYNKNTKMFFDTLFTAEKNRMKYAEVLKLMFPNVKKYFDNLSNEYIEFIRENPIFFQGQQNEYAQTVINRRIYNGRFFDLYFTMQENDFIFADNKVQSFVNFVNEKVYINLEEEKLKSEINDLLSFYNNENQKLVLDNLELYIDKINKNKFNLLINLINSHEIVNNTMLFLTANALERLASISAELIKTLDNNEITKLKKYLEQDYKNIHFWARVLYLLNPEGKTITYDCDENLYEMLNESFERAKVNIFKNEINMYSEKYYSRYNIRELKENYELQIKNVNSSNIFLLLSDVIFSSVGTYGYGYNLDMKRLENYISTDEVDKMLANRNYDQLTEKEKFVLSVYEKAKENSKNSEEENSVYRENYIDLRDLKE